MAESEFRCLASIGPAHETQRRGKKPGGLFPGVVRLRVESSEVSACGGNSRSEEDRGPFKCCLGYCVQLSHWRTHQDELRSLQTALDAEMAEVT